MNCLSKYSPCHDPSSTCCADSVCRIKDVYYSQCCPKEKTNDECQNWPIQQTCIPKNGYCDPNSQDTRCCDKRQCTWTGQYTVVSPEEKIYKCLTPPVVDCCYNGVFFPTGSDDCPGSIVRDQDKNKLCNKDGSLNDAKYSCITSAYSPGLFARSCTISDSGFDTLQDCQQNCTSVKSPIIKINCNGQIQYQNDCAKNTKPFVFGKQIDKYVDRVGYYSGCCDEKLFDPTSTEQDKYKYCKFSDPPMVCTYDNLKDMPPAFKNVIQFKVAYTKHINGLKTFL